MVENAAEWSRGVRAQLPVYMPSEEEKKNPRLYADNVRVVMVRPVAPLPS